MSVVPTEQPDPEELVIDAVRDGNRQAFADLVRRQNHFVRSVILGVLGEGDRVDDVAQQVWAACWERIGKLRDTARWRPWLYRLARNAAIDAGRSATRRRAKEQGVAVILNRTPTTATPDGRMIGEEDRRRMLRAIEALPALYREPFVLRHMNGWSYRQIGEVMDMPVDSIETRLVRARRLLRDCLKDQVQD